MQLVVCFSIDHLKRGKFSRNFLLSQVVLSMEAEAGQQPRKGSPRRLASSRTVSRAGLGTPTSQANILGFSSERPHSPRKRLSIRTTIAHRTACQFYYALDNHPGTPHQAPAAAK